MERRRSRKVRESFFGGENSRGTRGPARGRGRQGPGVGAGPFPGGREASPASRGAIAQQRIPGAPALEDFPAPGSGCPRQAPRARHRGSRSGWGRDPATRGSRAHTSACLCSRSGPERPCPTVPSSPARPPRECAAPRPVRAPGLPPLGVLTPPPGSGISTGFSLDSSLRPRSWAPVPPRTPGSPRY